MSDQWFRGEASGCETESPGFVSCMWHRGRALLSRSILVRNGRPLLLGIIKLSSLGRLIHSTVKVLQSPQLPY